MEVSIKHTDDGSDTLFSTQFNEHYHSIFGANNESQHVFIKHGLERYIETYPDRNNTIFILEIGFGTGLNCLLTLEKSKKISQKIDYHGIELYPVPQDVLSSYQYNLSDEVPALEITKVLSSPFDTKLSISDSFTLTKIHEDVTKFNYPDSFFNIIYFDAFAPDKQPSLWSLDMMKSMFRTLKVGGVLSTYCAKGQVRRDLKEAGFEVLKVEGPIGKREMMVAIKPAQN